MAKRKRLTGPLNVGADVPADLETKSIGDIPVGIVPPAKAAKPAQTPPGRRAPIADVAAEAAATSALQTLADQMDAARDGGRMVVDLPAGAVSGSHLTRDRVALDEEELDTLKASILARGQQTPIEVERCPDGTYGLISGFRRLTAIRELFHKGQLPTDTILALIRQPEDAADAYTAMVEENEIRVGLSYFERASIVVNTVRNGIFPHEKAALGALFGSASRSKRSKIKAFVPLVDEVGGFIKFPNTLTERLGLALAQKVATDPDWAERFRERMRKADPETAELETALITKAVAAAQGPAPVTAPKPAAPAAGHEVVPGIRMIAKGGELRLKGPGVDQDLALALDAWLRHTQG